MSNNTTYLQKHGWTLSSSKRQGMFKIQRWYHPKFGGGNSQDQALLLQRSQLRYEKRLALARKARCRVASRPTIDPNRISERWGKFWQGQTLTDWGYTLSSEGEGCNGNPAPVIATSPDGRRFVYDNNFHSWMKE